MVLIPPQARPGGATLLGNHEARIRALERLRTGWKFNFDNEGGWGYLQFNDDFDLDLLPDPLAVGSTWGAAIEEASGSGLLIGSTTETFVKSNTVKIDTSGPGDGSGIYGLRFDVAGSQGTIFDITGPNGEFRLNAPFIRLDSGGWNLRLLDSGEVFWDADGVSINWGSGYAIDSVDHAFDISTVGGTFLVNDHLGHALFRIDEAGTFHIKTGATWIADL